MADFNVGFSAPQGSGDTPIAGVQLQPTKEVNVLDTVGSIFHHELGEMSKDAQKQRKLGVTAGYTTEMQQFDQAFQSGQINASQYQTLSRSTYSKYAAMQGGEFVEAVNQAASGFEGHSNLNTAQQQIESEKKVRDSDISAASQAGYQFVPGMSKPQEDSLIKAHKTAVQERQRWDDFYKSQGEMRSQGTYDAANAEREGKKLALTSITNIAGSELSASQAFVVSLGDAVRSGKMSPEMAQAKLMERSTNVEAALTAASRMNPELAGPYRQIFQQINDLGTKLIDPKQQSEQVKDQLELLLNRAKLIGLADPRNAAVVATSQLLGPVAPLAVEAHTTANNMINTIAKAGSTPYGTGYVPQIVGNPDTEKDTLDVLKKAYKAVYGSKLDDKQKAEIEADNSANHILGQVSKNIDAGTDPASLKNLASFFASPEYGQLAARGGLDKDAQMAAKKVFQLTYEPAIIQGVMQKLDGNLDDKSGHKIKDAVDVVWNGAGVAFMPKNVVGATPVELKRQQELIKDLNLSQKAINQVIQIGAHLGGSTDYKSYFEDTKHILLPSMFSAPTEGAKATGGTPSPKQQPVSRTSSTGNDWWNK